MKDIEKIYKVLEIKKIAPTKAERLLGLSQGTLVKSWERKGNVHDSTKEKFLSYFLVNRQWWDTLEGEIFEKNLTSEISTPINKESGAVERLVRMLEKLQDRVHELEVENADLKKQLLKKD